MSAQTVAELLVEIGVKFEDAKKAEKAVEDLEDGVEDLDDASKKASTGFSRLVKGIRSGAKRAGAGVSSLVERFGGLKNILATGATALAGFTVGAGAFVASQAESLDATNKLATALGIGVEELQRLQFAAGQSGVEAQTLTQAMTRLNRGLDEVRTKGTGPTADAFARLGVSIEDLEGLTRTQQIGVIGDALNGVEDAATRSALAAQVFGEEAGPRMASMLAAGSEGLAQLAADARNVMSQEQADAASEFQDRMGELRAELGYVAATIGSELLPIAREMILGIKEWIGENQEFIKQDVPAFIEMIADALRDAWEAANSVADAVSWLYEKFQDLTGQSELFTTVMEGVGKALKLTLLPVVALINAVNDLDEALKNAGVSGRKLNKGIVSSVDDIRAEAERKGRENNIRVSVSDYETGAATGSSPSGGSAGRGRGSRGSRGSRGDSLAERGAGWFREFAQALVADQDARIAALPEPPGVTYEEVLREFRKGNFNYLNETFKGMAPRTPDVRDVKPTVAVTLNHIEVTQNIASTDPAMAGEEASQRLYRIIQGEIRKAEAAVGSNVKR